MKVFASKKIAFFLFLFLALFFLTAVSPLKSVVYAIPWDCTNICSDGAHYGCLVDGTCYLDGSSCGSYCSADGQFCSTNTLPDYGTCSSGDPTEINQSWAQYKGSCIAVVTRGTGSCVPEWSLYSINCNTGDKCLNSSNTYTNWGNPDCTPSTPRHTCCSAAGQPMACQLLSPYSYSPTQNRGDCNQENGNYEVEYGDSCASGTPVTPAGLTIKLNGVSSATFYSVNHTIGYCNPSGPSTKFTIPVSTGPDAGTSTCTGNTIGGGAGGTQLVDSNASTDGFTGFTCNTPGYCDDSGSINVPSGAAAVITANYGSQPNNLSTTQTCPNETFNWTKGNSSDTTKLFYCDETFAVKHGVTCTSGSAPSGTTTPGTPSYMAGWYMLWTGGNSNSPQNIPIVSTQFNPAAASLTEGDSYSWLVQESSSSNPTPGTDFPVASCDVVPKGFHDGATCSLINGWTCDPNNYSLPLNVDFYYDGPYGSGGKWLGSTTANVTREAAVGAQCGGNSAHGFNFTPPSSVIDGNIHSIYAYPINIDSSGNPTGNNPPLSGTPKTLGPCAFSISGFVYTDTNKNTKYDPQPPTNESLYTGPVKLTGTACLNGTAPCTSFTTVANNGNFNTGINLPAGEYIVKLTSVPDSSYSIFGNSYIVTVGPSCSPAPGQASSSCDANGNVLGVALGISNSNVWIQSTGGNIYMSNIQYSTIPANACGGNPYMSIAQAPANASPGIIYTGNSATDFGAGHASTNNWWVGGLGQYAEPIQISPTGAITTSYASISNLIAASGKAPTPLTSVAGCGNLSNCNLPSDLPAGAYTADVGVDGTFKLTAQAGTFDKGDYVILVNGSGNSAKTLIDSDISVPAGNTLLVSSNIDIHVDKSVGWDDSTNTTSNIEGYYSTDGSFIVDGNTLDGKSCPGSPDKRLNMQGAIVTNAVVTGSGTLQIHRDMCAGDLCPTLSIQARPDYILNTPALYTRPTLIQQQVSP